MLSGDAVGFGVGLGVVGLGVEGGRPAAAIETQVAGGHPQQ